MDNYEIEIDIKEILYRILVWWKVLLLIGLFASAIAAGLGFLMDKKEYDKTIEALSQQDKTYDQLVTTLSASSIKQYDRIKQAASLLGGYKSQLAYAENSYFMKFNASEVTSVNLLYRVVSENADAKVLLQVYQTYLTQQEKTDAIAKLLPDYDDGKYKYIGQVLTVSSNATEENSDSYYLNISVRMIPGTDQKALTAGLDTMVENIHRELIDKGFPHKNVKYDESIIKKGDSYISDAQRNYEKNKSELEKSIVDLNLTKQEQDLLYNTDLSGSDKDLASVLPKPKVNISYIVTGVLLAWGIFAVIIVLRMCIPVKIGTTEQFGHVRQLAIFRGKLT